jgi:hypothetical protein
MAITTPSMGLKRWDQPNDIFSYVELSDNLALLDAHDHSTGKGVQIPTAGIVNNAIDATKLADDSVTANKIPANSVAGSKLLNNGVPDTKLASPNNGVYRTLFQAGITLAAGALAGTFAANAHAGTPIVPYLFRWVPADYAVAGKTTQWRIMAVTATNATSPGVTVTPSVFTTSTPVGGAGALTLSTGSVFHSIAALTPTANYFNSSVSTDLAAPAVTAVYSLGVTTNATIAASSVVTCSLQLQMRHV